MKKRKTAVLSLILALAMILPLSVSALVPGDELEEIKTTQPIKIDITAPGKPVEVMDAVTGVSVSVSADVLPEGITAVALESAAVKSEAAKAAIAEITTKITSALSVPEKIADVVSKESEHVVKNFNVKPVSAVVLNLVDKSSATSKDKKVITELKKPVSFTIPVPAKVTAIAYIDPKTGKLVIIEGKVKNGFMTFDTAIVGVQFTLLQLTKK